MITTCEYLSIDAASRAATYYTSNEEENGERKRERKEELKETEDNTPQLTSMLFPHRHPL